MEETSASDTEATSMDHVVHETRSTTAGSPSPNKAVTCQLSFRLRKLRNRGALLILVINYLVICVFYHLSVYHVRGIPNKYYATLTWSLTLPIAGWLADIYCTRYKTIHCSMWVMWVASILSTVSYVIAETVEKYSQMNQYFIQVTLITMGFGFGGYQANVILFGLDQLHDASTEEITSFISWYVWTYLCSGVVVHFTYTCLGEYLVFSYLWVCICLSLALIMLLLFHKSLLKEPPATRKNPFRLIHNVLQYAVKNKHPRLRSAFTYCGNERPSRVDFGKTKYGGPFTTEQVEDVKTFLRMLVVISVSSALFGNLYAAEQLREKMLKLLTLEKQLCSKHHIWDYAIHLVALGFVPLYEFVLYPLLHKYLYRVKSIGKLLIGAVLQILRLCFLLAIELTSRHIYSESLRNNATLPCIFMLDKSALESTLNTSWLTIPDLLNYTSIAIYAIAAFEFICSQSPYSMRGLLLGAGYGCIVLLNLVMFGLVQPFTRNSSTWGTGIISCGFWFLMFMILLMSVGFAALCAVVKWYKHRKREDVLPNEHIFAEQYYAKKISSMHT